MAVCLLRPVLVGFAVEVSHRSLQFIAGLPCPVPCLSRFYRDLICSIPYTTPQTFSFLFSIHSARWFSHQFLLVLYVAILSRPLFILILPPILFRHFQKFSKLLHSFRLQRPSIHLLPIMFQPRIIFTSLLCIILRRIPLIGLNKRHHLLVFTKPTFILLHALQLRSKIIPRILSVHPQILTFPEISFL